MMTLSHSKKPIECFSTQSIFLCKHFSIVCLDTQLCTTFSSSELEYFCTLCGSRTYEKTVSGCSLSLLWLIGSFWHKYVCGSHSTLCFFINQEAVFRVRIFTIWRGSYNFDDTAIHCSPHVIHNLHKHRIVKSPFSSKCLQFSTGQYNTSCH